MDTNDIVKSISLDYLPLALWMHILSFLPVKSLLIFRSVCKFFLNIIDDSYFISLHRYNFPANNQVTRTLVLGCLDADPKSDFWCVASCEILEFGSTKTKKWIESETFFHESRTWTVAGSLDGLLLLVHHEAMLWNPCIKKYRELPFPTTKPLDTDINIPMQKYGLGYDVSCNDYKVHCIIDPYLNDYPRLEQFDEMPEMIGSWVYSVKTRSWVKSELPNCREKRDTSTIMSFKGELVWIEGVHSSEGYYHHLVRFDFATISYRYCYMPYPIKNNLWIQNRLVMLDGGSSFGIWGLDSNDLVGIWAMDESSLSWTRLYNFREGVLQLRAFQDPEMIWEYWTKGVPKPKVSLYVEDEKRDQMYWKRDEPYYTGDYVESLVLSN